jgi:hypothetical protein
MSARFRRTLAAASLHAQPERGEDNEAGPRARLGGFIAEERGGLGWGGRRR